MRTLNYMGKACFIALMSFMSVSASAEGEVGQVLDVKGRSMDFEFLSPTRPDAKVVFKGLLLKNGDVIKVLSETNGVFPNFRKNEVVLKLAGKTETVIVTYDTKSVDGLEHSYKVDNVSGEQHYWTEPLVKVSTEIGKVFLEVLKGTVAAIASITTRGPNNDQKVCQGEEFSFPLLEVESRLVASEQRPISFGWCGGKSTYQLQIKVGNDWSSVKPTPEFHQLSEGKGYTLYKATLSPMKYSPDSSHQVRIVDCQNGNNCKEVRTGTFKVVAKFPEPPIKDVAEQKKLPTNWEAIWLAKQDQGQWKLEAYQKVANISQEENLSDWMVKAWLSGLVKVEIK